MHQIPRYGHFGWYLWTQRKFFKTDFCVETVRELKPVLCSTMSCCEPKSKSCQMALRLHRLFLHTIYIKNNYQALKKVKFLDFQHTV